jgi:hypothetical protein
MVDKQWFVAIFIMLCVAAASADDAGESQSSRML